jgi:hypothetical protein
MWLRELLTKPFTGTGVARAALDESRSERPRVTELARDLRALEEENHITAKVHDAARGRPDGDNPRNRR